MSDRNLSLTDVMLGVYNLGLCSKIPAAQFKFLIGLILKGNSLGFKPVMEITNGEAMAIGGGNSRQSVNRLRQKLCEFTIDDKPILDVVHGEHLKNVSAKYEVNYDLLAGNGSMWRKPKPLASQNCDASVDGYDDGNEKTRHKKVTDAVTTPRSDQKRSDQKEERPKKAYLKTGVDDITNIKKAMYDRWGIFSVSDGAVNNMLKLEELLIVPARKGQDQTTRKEVWTTPEYAPLRFWFDMINRMDKPEHGINTIADYGKKAWKDWAEANNIRIY